MRRGVFNDHAWRRLGDRDATVRPEAAPSRSCEPRELPASAHRALCARLWRVRRTRKRNNHLAVGEARRRSAGRLSESGPLAPPELRTANFEGRGRAGDPRRALLLQSADSDGTDPRRTAWPQSATARSRRSPAETPTMIGRSVGHYEVVAKLGEGGMGEVYRARDMQRGRDVAIKVLPEAVAADPDRLMRFEREARTLAALNHPHIAQVYGLETSGHSRAIVMELVDGEDLAERIRRGALPLDEAIAIARQIADALETAHDAGIVHRDLKPANVRVTRDGRVKVLDFGLAKALGSEGARATSDAVTLPTLTSPAMTQAGIILGTAAYMAPEQARGRAVDRRADLWALGCVLYEMLSATRPFDGETTTDVLSAVVSKEPDWSKLPQGTPPAVSRLLRRCLRKDARLRLQSAGDARVELDDALAEPAAEIAAPPRRVAGVRWLPALAFTAAGAAIAVLALSVMRPRAGVSTDPPAMRFTIALPPGMTRVGAPEISPDGRWIAIPAMGPLGQGGQLLAIWLRAVDGDTFRPIAGTEVASAAFWSPDSRELAFAKDSALFRIPVAGGTPVRIAQIATAGGGVR